MVIRKETEPKKIKKAYEIFKILGDLKNIHDLSYVDLAKTLEINRTAVRRYISGEIMDVPYENVQKVCDFIKKITGQTITLNMVNSDIADDRIIINHVTKLLKNPKKKRQLRMMIKVLEVEEY